MYKYYIVLFLILNLNSITYSQSIKELKVELSESKNKYDSLLKEFYNQQMMLMSKIATLESTIGKIKLVIGSVDVMEAKNLSTPEYNNSPNSSATNATIISTVEKPQPVNTGTISVKGKGDGLTPTTGATIYSGPRGGRYYINKNGNKVYIKK
jgi:hypothetical protein